MEPQRAFELVQGVVRFYNFLPPGDAFLDDVLTGLAQPQKSIPPKYFYGERGSQLFETICGLPEYYPARTEMAIMRSHIADMAQFAGPSVELIELGAGAGVRTRLLIERLQPPLYVPVDTAGDRMRAGAGRLASLFPWLNISGIFADFTRPLVLPEFVGVPVRKKAAFFSGSAIGNFAPTEALGFLKQARRLVGTGGTLLIGVDLKKDKKTLDAACNDAQGVVAEFNLNLLERINRELGADFQVKRFRHKAFYDPIQGWIEMHLESLYAQFAHVAGRRFDFAEGETIRTGISCKFSIAEFQELGGKAGFSPQKVWTDPGQVFSVHGMMAI
jgi:dimethylhistidine N-methyltransferase